MPGVVMKCAECKAITEAGEVKYSKEGININHESGCPAKDAPYPRMYLHTTSQLLVSEG